MKPIQEHLTESLFYEIIVTDKEGLEIFHEGGLPIATLSSGTRLSMLTLGPALIPSRIQVALTGVLGSTPVT